MKKIIFAFLFTIVFLSLSIFAQIPVKTLVQISRAEDELRYDKVLEDLMKNSNAEIRRRAALAGGRIGNEAAIPALTNLLENDKDENVKETAAFAIGEIESIKGADAILKVLNNLKNNPSIRARAVEAAGKIAAANAKDEKSKALGEAILQNLTFENEKRSAPFENVIELGLTAVLRARPAEAEQTLVKFIEAYTPQIRANALNTLTRLRAKNANKQARELLQKDADAIVRANAARVLGAAEDKDAFELLLNAALNDTDSRVRVSAIRSLGSLKDAKAADKLLERGEKLLADYKKSKFANPVEKNELLEIATVLGNILKGTNSEKTIDFLVEFLRWEVNAPEIYIAIAKVAPDLYPSKTGFGLTLKASATRFNWLTSSSEAQGKGELPDTVNKEIRKIEENTLRIYFTEPEEVRKVIGYDYTSSIPDLLRAFAKFKTDDLSEILRTTLAHKDLFVRAATAELLGEQPATKENIEALKIVFANSLKTDKNYNDAQLAILSALVKLDKTQSYESIRLALNAPDYLVRKHAANLIKENDLMKDVSNADKFVGTVKPYDAKTGTKLGQLLNTEADYVRAVSRKNGSVKAVLTTEKGKFTIDLMPEDAPLTVDNFIKLARTNYFNGISVHRVVPNFVMQDGDPRGDGNGGPGYSIRCELNMLEYKRGAVGMALSGKDTGGSQWFVTHSPQPHLDGGYTVFGKVNETDMKIVDQIVRGDKILKVEIVEKK
ncbi:hypothetical protein BH20ACI4_BH20ACI4_19790 [soil metagenome]